MQIDAHTSFRHKWDALLIEQMRKTPSYPKTVISNYPRTGDPSSTRRWAAPSQWGWWRWARESTPAALCACSFEDAGAGRLTVRLQQKTRKLAWGVDKTVPRRSCFVAAGFLMAHGSIMNEVPFDPFMPYLFMGEEISLSVRFWTSGYDIYAPAIDVLGQCVGQLCCHTLPANEPARGHLRGCFAPP